MNQRQYRERLTADLDRWIGAGLVPAESRAAILADLGPEPAGRTGLWLGMTAAVLAGLAIIAGVADNWALIPRALKLALLIALFWAALGAAILGDRRGQTVLRNAGSLLAALIFAASIGLIGQALNIPGEPDRAVLFASIGAGLIALAGASPAAGLVYLVLAAIWYGFDGLGFWGSGGGPSSLDGKDLVAGLFLAGGFAFAYLFPSRVMLHAGLALAGPYVLFVFLQVADEPAIGYVVALLWGLVGAGGYLMVRSSREGGATLLGWSAWHGFLAFAFAGIEASEPILHRIVWLGLSIAVIAIGARAKQGWTTAAAVLSMVIACFVLMSDLGLSLGLAALIFGAAAIATLIAARVIRRPGEETS